MTVHRTITVAVGRFDPLIGYGLSYMLSTDRRLSVIATDLDDPELEHTVASQSPNVAVVAHAAQALRLTRRKAAEFITGFLVLTHQPSYGSGMNLLAGGITCVACSSSMDDILDAVRVTGEGRLVFISGDGQWIDRQYPGDIANLTLRETDVLRYLTTGRSNREIANALHISTETVRSHVASIRRKLNVQSKRDLIGMPIPEHRLRTNR